MFKCVTEWDYSKTVHSWRLKNIAGVFWVIFFESDNGLYLHIDSDSGRINVSVDSVEFMHYNINEMKPRKHKRGIGCDQEQILALKTLSLALVKFQKK